MAHLGLIAQILMVVGAINWGLVGLLNLDLVVLLLGSVPLLVKIVYILIGAAGVYGAWTLIKSRA